MPIWTGTTARAALPRPNGNEAVTRAAFLEFINDVDAKAAWLGATNAFTQPNTFQADLTLSAGRLLMGAAASRLVPGATSFSIRNNADGADNLLVSDAGDVTVRRVLAIASGSVQVAGADTGIQINTTVPAAGASMISFKRAGVTHGFLWLDGSNNLLFTDAPGNANVTIHQAGGATIHRGSLLVSGGVVELANASNAGYRIRTDQISGTLFEIQNRDTGNTDLRIDRASGNVRVRSILGIGGNDPSGAESSCLYLGNIGVAIVTNPTNGGYLYVEGGALKYRGSSGTVTPLANA